MGLSISDTVYAGEAVPVNPTGTITITQNGTTDVTQYESANVSVAGVPRTVDANGVLQFPTITADFLGGATDIGDYVFYQAFYSSTSSNPATASGVVDMSSLVSISGANACNSMFRGCTGITSVDLSSLTTVSGANACNNMFRDCTGITGALDLSSLTTANGTNACSYMFQGCTGITGKIDLSSLTVGYCNYMFYGCTGITSVDLSNLKSGNISYMFSGCTGLTGAIDLSSLGYSNGISSVFNGCTGITSVDLSSLNEFSNNAANLFTNCTSLTSVDLSSLATIYASGAFQNAFRNCTSLTSLSFPALNTTSFGSQYVNQFNNMLSGVTGCTLHFPKNLDPQTGKTTISGLTGYPNFGGTDTVLVFDLPSALFLTGANDAFYDRNPKYDTATALAWFDEENPDLNEVPYYTSGTADPQVGDTIYSDAACTTPVTTISVIEDTI